MPQYQALSSFIYQGAVVKAGEIVIADSIPSILADKFRMVDNSMTVDTKTVPKINLRIPDAGKLPPIRWSSLYRVDIFLTGRCNINCAHCSQKGYRQDHADIDKAVVFKVIDRIRDSKLKTKISYTGGEPTLHPDFPEIVEYVAKNLPFDTYINLLSNLTYLDIICDSIDKGYVKGVYSNLANCHAKNADELLSRYGKDVVKLSSYGHLPLPKTPVWDSIPADCHCPGVALMGNKIYACPNLYSLAKQHGYLHDDDPLVCDVDDDWIEYFKKNENMKYRNYLCTLCPSNAYVKKEITENEKVKRYSSGI